MLINLASLNVRTFYPEIWSAPIPVEQPDRDEDESIEHYTLRKMDEKITLFRKSLDSVLNCKVRNGKYLFFTLPEFFWNISPYAIWTKNDLAYLSEYYMDNMPVILNKEISLYPNDKFGNIIILAGTVGTLIETENNYDAINYLLCVDNIKISKNGTASLSMWPKKEVASYDYGLGSSNGDGSLSFLMGKPGHPLHVRVNMYGKNMSEHNSDTGYGPAFDNNIVPEIPFAISICADYANSLSLHQDEWLNKNPNIHFLIACGMPLSSAKEYTQSVLFAVRNDGFDGSLYEPKAGGCELRKVNSGFIDGDNIEPITIVDDNLFIYEVDIE